MKKVLTICVIGVLCCVPVPRSEAMMNGSYGGYTTVSYSYPLWINNDEFLVAQVEHHVRYIHDFTSSERPYRDDGYVIKRNINTGEETIVFKTVDSDIYGMSYCFKTEKLYLSMKDQLHPPAKDDPWLMRQPKLHEYDLRTGTLKVLLDNVLRPRVSPDGDIVAFVRKYEYNTKTSRVNSCKETIRFYFMNTGEVKNSFLYSGLWDPSNGLFYCKQKNLSTKQLESFWYDPYTNETKPFTGFGKRLCAISNDASLYMSCNSRYDQHKKKEIQNDVDYGGQVSISPDNLRILFVSYLKTKKSHVVLHDLTTGKIQVLYTNERIEHKKKLP